MPNQKYLELQAQFYAQSYKDRLSYDERIKELRKLYDCMVWGTYEKQLIPCVFMTDSHLMNAFHHKRKQAQSWIELKKAYSNAYKEDSFKRCYHAMIDLQVEMERRKWSNTPAIPLHITVAYKDTQRYSYLEGLSEYDFLD